MFNSGTERSKGICFKERFPEFFNIAKFLNQLERPKNNTLVIQAVLERQEDQWDSIDLAAQLCSICRIKTQVVQSFSPPRIIEPSVGKNFMASTIVSVPPTSAIAIFNSKFW